MACLFFFREKLKSPFYIYPRSRETPVQETANQSKLGNKKHMSYNRVTSIPVSVINFPSNKIFRNKKHVPHNLIFTSTIHTQE